MKRFIAVVAALLLGGAVQAQNNALAQLGAKGVTDVGGSAAYARYLVRLGSDGRMSSGMLPAGFGDAQAALSRLIYLDPVTGVDGVGTVGALGLPYRTLAYAASRSPQKNEGGTVYFLNPGTYAAATLDVSASPGITNITIAGQGAQVTYIPAITFSAAGTPLPLTVNLTGVHVGTLRQQNNRAVIVHMAGGALVNTAQADYASDFTLYRDPDTAVATTSGSGNFTNILTHSAADISYYGAGNYTNVWYALDRLFGSVAVAEVHIGTWTNSAAYGITAGDVERWDTTALSGSNDVLWTETAVAWSNSAAKLITGNDTNRWNAAATPSKLYAPADTSRWIDGTGGVWRVNTTTNGYWLFAVLGTEGTATNALYHATDAPFYFWDETGPFGVPGELSFFWVFDGGPGEGHVYVEFQGEEDTFGYNVSTNEFMDGVFEFYTSIMHTRCRMTWTNTTVTVTTQHVDSVVFESALAAPVPLGPEIAGVQSLFYTDGTNLFWRNVNAVTTRITRPDAVYSATGITNIWTGTAAQFITATNTPPGIGADIYTVYLIQEE